MAAAPSLPGNSLRIRLYTTPARWVYLKELNACLCVPCKNGVVTFTDRVRNLLGLPKMSSTDLMVELNSRCAGPFLPWEIETLFPDVPHYLSIRDPVDRFASLWRNKCRDRKGSPLLHGMLPGELISHIEKHPHENHHWFKQSLYLTDRTTCFKHDEFFDRAGLRGEGKLNSAHKYSSDMPMPEARILRHYREDQEIYAGL